MRTIRISRGHFITTSAEQANVLRNLPAKNGRTANGRDLVHRFVADFASRLGADGG